MTNVQSPGSQSSKGSSSVDQDYNSAPTVPDVLANFINNNYGNNNYYVADFESNFLRQMLICEMPHWHVSESGTVRRAQACLCWKFYEDLLLICGLFTDIDRNSNSGSTDNLNFDEIDEIDTNQMQIYDGAPAKARRPDVFTSEKSQLTTKQEPVDDRGVSKASGKSLLKNIETQQIDADQMLNTLNEVASGEAGPSSNVELDPIVFDAAQVSFKSFLLFFKAQSSNSQTQNSLLHDELFSFGGKTGEQEKVEDMIVTKYNPKHTSDIQRLNSVTDFSSHLENVQNDLDTLKDLLHNDNYQMETNQLLGVRLKIVKVDVRLKDSQQRLFS